MPRPASTTLSLDALLVASGAAHAHRQDSSEPAPMTALATMVGRPPRTMHRWAREGVPFYAADAAAAACGLHPNDVWGEAWADAVERQHHIENGRILEGAA